MSDDEVGYRKPPRRTRFRKGICPNPLGRGARKESPLCEAIEAFHNELVTYTEHGRTKQAPRSRLTVQRHVTAALNGSVKSARLLLDQRLHVKQHAIGDDRIRIVIEGGLPSGLSLDENQS